MSAAHTPIASHEHADIHAAKRTPASHTYSLLHAGVAHLQPGACRCHTRTHTYVDYMRASVAAHMQGRRGSTQESRVCRLQKEWSSAGQMVCTRSYSSGVRYSRQTNINPQMELTHIEGGGGKARPPLLMRVPSRDNKSGCRLLHASISTPLPSGHSSRAGTAHDSCAHMCMHTHQHDSCAHTNMIHAHTPTRFLHTFAHAHTPTRCLLSLSSESSVVLSLSACTQLDWLPQE